MYDRSEEDSTGMPIVAADSMIYNGSRQGIGFSGELILLPPAFVRVCYDEIDCIEWVEATEGRSSSCVPASGCLEAFMKLADASAEEVARFVRKWGP